MKLMSISSNLAQENIIKIGDLIYKGWVYKNRLSNLVKNREVEKIEHSLKTNSYGLKILGAGGAGFLLVLAKNHKKISNILNKKEFRFEIDYSGVKEIHNE